MDLLTVNEVTKNYGDFTALEHVSLAVPQGKVYGLLGPNGAGKTTLIRIINHITAPDSGEVIFDGHQLTQEDVAMIGYLPEERGLYKKMKVGDQAVFFARLRVCHELMPHELFANGLTASRFHPGGTVRSKNSPKVWPKRYSS